MAALQKRLTRGGEELIRHGYESACTLRLGGEATRGKAVSNSTI